MKFADRNFVRMQLQTKFCFQKQINAMQNFIQICFLLVYNNKIVCVAKIIFDFQLSFYEPIQFIEIYVGKNLRSYVADRNSFFFFKKFVL